MCIRDSKYTVTLLYDKGAHAIEIESVALYEGEKEIARDAHSVSYTHLSSARWNITAWSASANCGWTFTEAASTTAPSAEARCV